MFSIKLIHIAEIKYYLFIEIKKIKLIFAVGLKCKYFLKQ